tara:strand:- start:327 stop:947 length:621 start_codon:yes stop_codon:yes gene_type:complete
MSTLTVGTIAEKVTDAGVAVDGVTLKDGGAVFTSAVTATDNTVDLGASGTRFKDIYLSGGAFLGGTGSANKISDYEEGDWTPTLSTNNGSSASASMTQSSYTKIGRMVYITARVSNINTSGTTSSSELRITGLPFTIDTATTNGSVLSDNVTFQGSRTQLTLEFNTGEFLRFMQMASASSETPTDHGDINSGVTDIFFSGFYFTSA